MLKTIIGQPCNGSIICRVKPRQTTVQLGKRAGFDDVGHRLGLTTGAQISACKAPGPSADSAMPLTGMETVRSLLLWEGESSLQDRGVVYQHCTDHQNRCPGFSPLTSDVSWYRSTPHHRGFRDYGMSDVAVVGWARISWCIKPGFHPNATHATQAIAFGWKPGFSRLSWHYVSTWEAIIAHCRFAADVIKIASQRAVNCSIHATPMTMQSADVDL